MAKILFTADIHIKLNQKNVPVEWAKNRFYMFIEQFLTMQDNADVVVLGGDIFDRAPNTEELQLYFELINSMDKRTIIFSGNHEAVKRNTTFLDHLRRATMQVNPLVTIWDSTSPVYHNETELFDVIPYTNIKDKQFQEPTCRILCTHVRGAIPPHVKPEVDLDRFNGWELVLAGDLHSYTNSQRNILYPGSPYTVGFHRTETKTGALLVDSDTLKHEWLEFELPQLIRKTVKVGEPTPATDFHHTMYEVEGDISELSGIVDSELVEKRTLKRSSESNLLLTKEMSLTEEVKEYLLYISELKPDNVEQVITELQQHTGKI